MKIYENNKEVISIVLSAAMLATGVYIPELQSSVNAEIVYDASEWTIINGVVTEYKGDDEEVVIPEGVTSIGSYAFSGCSGLNKIVIPESVTSIGSYAFNGCSGLNKIVIPESVTSIEFGAFTGCSGLNKIVIPESVTSIGIGAFNGCKSLSEIEIPEGVTSIGNYAFCDCGNLREIVIPGSVTSIGKYAFSNCINLNEIMIYNPKVKIGLNIIPTNTTIIGYADSTAEAYAKEEGYTFVNIESVSGSATESPETEPSTTEPPTTESPSTEPPTTELPSTEPLTTELPSTEPSRTELPSIEPPTTKPSITESPTTEPPTTASPSTESPTTASPSAEVPSTEPPTSEVPTTKPSETEKPQSTYQPPELEPAEVPVKAADTPVWDGKVDSTWDGKGTKASPYLVTTPQEFAGMLMTSEEHKGSYYKLTRDIDLGGKPLRETDPDGEWGGRDWGKLEFDYFYGNFDGDYHLISGFYQKSTTGEGYRYSYDGLFGAMNSVSSVKNVVVSGRTDCGAALSGYLGGIVSNCTSYVDCYGTSGGMVQYAYGNASLDHCYNYGTVVMEERAAGIVGAGCSNIEIEKCFNGGTITAGGYASGIITGNNWNISVKECINKGMIEAPTGYAGGISYLGFNSMSQNYAICAINAAIDKGFGLIATSAYGTTISNCYYSGNASSLSPDDSELTYSKVWTEYPEDGIVDINGGEEEYYVINDLSKCQNDFPVLAWEAESFNVDELKQSSVTQTTIGLRWSVVPRATGYEIYRCDSKNGEMELLDTVNSVQYTDESLKSEKTYYYKVRSYLTENGHTYYGEFANVLSCSTLAEYKPGVTEYKLGDPDEDGTIALKDAQLVLKAALRIITLNKQEILAGDVDGNGTIELKDAQTILKVALKIITLPDMPVQGSSESEEPELNTSVFDDYVREELISQYGLSALNQEQIIQKAGDSWLNPEGILSATVYDLDQDEQGELLLMNVEATGYYEAGILYTITMSVYEEESGAVVLKDKIDFTAHESHSNKYDNQYLTDIVSDQHRLGVAIVNAIDTNYIVCENYVTGGAFADGDFAEYWALTYNDGKFSSAFEVTQDFVGSFGITFTACEYTKDQLVNKKEYDEENGDSLAEAIRELFGGYGITTNSSFTDNSFLLKQSILSDSNTMKKVMDYTISVKKADYANSNYTMQAVLKDYSDAHNMN